jgi:DNA-binding XRE family transcriptional regulator
MKRKPLYPELCNVLPVWTPQVLRRMRKRIYLTQIQAALLCRVSPHTWRSWENGQRFMPEIAWAYFLVQYRKVRKILKDKAPRLDLVEGGEIE